jgi:hypothetical protein
MRLEELLEQNQKTITETTGLLKRLHELSISIAEKQQRQLDGVGAWQATVERQLDAIVGWQAATERTLQLWERHATEVEGHAVAWQATTEQMLQRLAESQVLLAESQAATDRRLQALAELLERFLRGSNGDGHTTS